MEKQQTLAGEFSLYGKGLNTGLNIKITFKPAPENYGYKIIRVDLENKSVIDALAENVSSTERCTALCSNGIQVATVEHAMAAFYACGTDNCMIEVDGTQFSILDGSSMLYVQEIEKVGLKEQKAAGEYLTFDKSLNPIIIKLVYLYYYFLMNHSIFKLRLPLIL